MNSKDLEKLFNSKDSMENKIKILLEQHYNTIKNDILYFKNDLLKELNTVKQEFYSKCNHIGIELQNRIKLISSNNIELNKKIESVSTTIDSKIENILNYCQRNFNFEGMLEDVKKTIYANDVKTINIKNELKEHIDQYNNIIRNNILYKGIIGPGCKFVNMHELVDFLLANINNLNVFKEQKTYDTKMYKYKIENALENINNSTNNIIDMCKLYVNQVAKEIREKFNSEIKLYDSRLVKLRMENTENFEQLKNKMNDFDEEFNKIMSIKEDIFEITGSTITQINEFNNNKSNAINELKKELKLMKMNLAEFLQGKEKFKEKMEKEKKFRISSSSSTSHLYSNKHYINNLNKTAEYKKKTMEYKIRIKSKENSVNNTEKNSDKNRNVSFEVLEFHKKNKDNECNELNNSMKISPKKNKSER